MFSLANYKPKFVPGPTPCQIKSFVMYRGRLLIGGTFFRNRHVGGHHPQLQCQLLTNELDGNLQPIGPLVYTTELSLHKSVELHVWGVGKTGTPSDKKYYASQTFIVGGPPDYIDTWTNAIPSLRSQINAKDPLVTMPTSDVIEPYNTSEETYIIPFGPASMYVETTAPSTPAGLAQLRTGPDETIIFVTQSETETIDNGALQDVNALFSWDGTSWVPRS